MNFNPVANRPLSHRILVTIGIIGLGILLGCLIAMGIRALLPQNTTAPSRLELEILSMEQELESSILLFDAYPNPHQPEMCHLCKDLSWEIELLATQRNFLMEWERHPQSNKIESLDRAIESLTKHLNHHTLSHAVPMGCMPRVKR